MGLNTGFDPDEIRNAIQNVNNSYNDLCNALGSQFQDKFVSFMSQNWACQEAQEFFSNVVEPTMTDLRQNVDTIFESVVTAMDTAAFNWANQTGNTGIYSRSAFDKSSQNIDVSIIRENIDNVRGINDNCMSEAETNLAQVTSDSENALEAAINGVVSSGFIGGDQQANLNNSLNQIKANIENSLNELVNQFKNAVDETIQKYNIAEFKASTAFEG